MKSRRLSARSVRAPSRHMRPCARTVMLTEVQGIVAEVVFETSFPLSPIALGDAFDLSLAEDRWCFGSAAALRTECRSMLGIARC